MKISYDWLQQYFSAPLPSPDELAGKLIQHAFEVEGLEKVGEDTVMDVKVLPDRAHDCLCHFGVAKEVAAILNIGRPVLPATPVFQVAETGRKLSISIEDERLCRRYIGRVIEGVEIGESPEWLKRRLEAVGQRSINSVVDATNYVMLSIGQPLHAFDADKVKGGVTVRPAREGESMVTLDGKEVALDPSMLVIADDEGPLALAGIKGGKRAEVDAQTRNLILEAANFHPSNVRRTSGAVGIRNDSSKRFENELTPAIADLAMDMVTGLIIELAGGTADEKIDRYPSPVQAKPIEVHLDRLNRLLGVEVPAEEAKAILVRLGFEVEEREGGFTVTPPVERLDVEIPENVAEEVGRLYGYGRVPAVLPEPVATAAEPRPVAYIRRMFADAGFSETYGYAFSVQGEVEVANPLASDLKYLRPDLSTGLKSKLEFNLRHVLFDTDPVKIFEIGKVFSADRESVRCALAIGYGKKKLNTGEAEIAGLVARLEEAFGVPLRAEIRKDDLTTIAEFDLEGIARAPEASLEEYYSQARYEKLSPYPRIIRDVALFVPPEIQAEEVAAEIRTAAGPLLSEGPVLFDVYEKKGESGAVEKKSLAFRMAFQSHEKTLSDEEANAMLAGAIEALERRGWEVRK